MDGNGNGWVAGGCWDYHSWSLWTTPSFPTKQQQVVFGVFKCFQFFCHAVQLLNPLSGVVQVGERVVHINGVPAAGQDLMLRPRWTQHGVLTIWRFHSHGGTPSHHPFQWDFPNKNHPAIRGNPHFRIPPKNVGPLNSQGISWSKPIKKMIFYIQKLSSLHEIIGIIGFKAQWASFVFTTR